MDSRTFAVRLAERLGVEPHYIIAGYEDVWHYLWKERRLPTNVDPFKSELTNEQERLRLARIFEEGLNKVVGYCLPLRRDRFAGGTGAWISGEWFLRPERMYLIPGDSPMGYRLPLDSLPWVAPADFPHILPHDPWAARNPLPSRDAITQMHYLIGCPRRSINRARRRHLPGRCRKKTGGWRVRAVGPARSDRRPRRKKPPPKRVGDRRRRTSNRER